MVLQEELATPVWRTHSFSGALLDSGMSLFVNLIPRSPELEAIVIDQPATTAEALAATRGTDGLGLVVVEDAAEAVMPKAMPGQA